MKIADQTEEIQQFINNKLTKSISCARKTVKGKRVELLFCPVRMRYTVANGEEEFMFNSLKKACECFDAIDY